MEVRPYSRNTSNPVSSRHLLPPTVTIITITMQEDNHPVRHGSTKSETHAFYASAVAHLPHKNSPASSLTPAANPPLPPLHQTPPPLFTVSVQTRPAKTQTTSTPPPPPPTHPPPRHHPDPKKTSSSSTSSSHSAPSSA